MRRTFLRAVLMTGAAFVTLPLLGTSLAAHDFRAGELAIDHPWTRAVGTSAPTAAGYMVIRNTGSARIAWSPPRRRARRVSSCTRCPSPTASCACARSPAALRCRRAARCGWHPAAST